MRAGQPRRTIRVVAFGAEEVGLFGSLDYFRRHREGHDVVLVSESDFGADRVWRADFSLAPGNAALQSRVAAALAPLGIVPSREAAGAGADLGHWARAGVPRSTSTRTAPAISTITTPPTTRSTRSIRPAAAECRRLDRDAARGRNAPERIAPSPPRRPRCGGLLNRISAVYWPVRLFGSSILAREAARRRCRAHARDLWDLSAEPCSLRKHHDSTLLAAARFRPCCSPPAQAQEAGADGTRYMQPPAPIAQILDTAPPPLPLVNPTRDTVALLGRSNLPPVAELAEPELRLGGYRINPRNNGPANSRLSWNNALSFQDIASKQIRDVPLPQGTRFVAPSWSPDGGSVAFLRGAENGLELWVANRASAQARRVTGPTVNAAFGTTLEWLPTAARCWSAWSPPAAARRLPPLRRRPARSSR
jgi:hypothetical protein